jgi:alpha-D-xyloside xylohydrolase
VFRPGIIWDFFRNPLEFELELTENLPLQVEDSETEMKITSGSLSLTIGKTKWFMEYRRDGKLITKSIGRDLALLKTDFKGIAYDKGDSTNTYIRQQLNVGVGEYIYGMGERFTSFIKMVKP